MTRISAIVPATDSPATLPRCLAALRRAEEGPDEIVVVDRPASAGPAEARNAGAARAAGDVLVFVDADVVVHADAFRRIRAAFAADPALAGLVGSYDDDPAAPGAVSGFRNLLHHHVHHAGAGPVATFWAGLGALRALEFHAVGGFDAERYPHASVEDIELGLRLAERGAPVVLDSRVQGTHLKAWTLRTMVETDLRRRALPWLELLLEGRGRRELNLGLRHRASAALALAAAVGVGRGRLGLAAAASAGLVALNRELYLLVLRRRGPAQAAAAPALHALHHLSAVAAVPVAVLTRLRRRARP